MEEQEFKNEERARTKDRLLLLLGIPSLLVGLLMIVLFVVFIRSHRSPEKWMMNASAKSSDSELWAAPDTHSLGDSEHDKLIRYGRDLIARTSFYLGPEGTVKHMSNGMNCQNCHLDAGTKVFGNNYAAVAANYPKFRARSGTMEDVYKRVNDCIQRSLNGTALDTASREMQAIKAYILWVGKDVEKGKRPKGAGITELAYLDRAADVEKGKLVYVEKCAICHGPDGEGIKNTDTISYPPLWGKNSYNTGAGLFRLSRFAGYVKSNMPFGTNHDNPQLTDEEAWDVAAFVNSQPRPAKDLSKDWPKIAGKPVDHPFGPYDDTFSERQHKYGPFGPIEVYRKAKEAEKKVSP
jgi:thiosulfate dehydrogenase